jgi:two-component system, OmpR family, sensor kinase
VIAVLALLTAAIGGASALMGVLAARLGLDTRAAWLGSAVGCGVLVVLSESGGVATSRPSAFLDTVQLLVPCLVVVFLLVALVRPAPGGGWPVGALIVAAVVLVALAAAVAAVVPSAVTGLSDRPSSCLGVSAAWSALAVAVAVTALGRRERALGALALGVAMLGAVHLADLMSDPPLDVVRPLVPVLCLVAVALVLVGSLRLLWRVLVGLDAERDTQEEELRLAMVRLDRTAERDHELRTGLAGLVGAARLLGEGEDQGPVVSRAPLQALVASEIQRLEDVLEGSGPGADSKGIAAYDVEPVLRGLVALRRASGTDVRIEVDAGLRAMGSPDTLAAVMTNVFANAERHAPGSPVRVTAMRWRDRVVVRVRDFGPGIEPGRERAVLERGVHDIRRGGSGLGLHVCRRMLSGEHGSIAIRPRAGGRPGCTVVVDLRDAESGPPAWPVPGSVRDAAVNPASVP